MWRPSLNKSSYIKINTVFGHSKYSFIRIDKNILGINNLFFYKNQKFRSEGGPFVYISDFFERDKVTFFRFISKQIPYFVTLNALVECMITNFGINSLLLYPMRSMWKVL